MSTVLAAFVLGVLVVALIRYALKIPWRLLIVAALVTLAILNVEDIIRAARIVQQIVMLGHSLRLW